MSNFQLDGVAQARQRGPGMRVIASPMRSAEMSGMHGLGAIRTARGNATGMIIPADGDALLALGEGFLTEAFRAFGAMSGNNHVARIARVEECHAGSTGQKLLLLLEYGFKEDGLPAELFVKFSRDFNNTFRDRRRGELEAEIRLAKLSRSPNFPIHVPRAIFADSEASTGTALLIAERIDFGRNGIEPLRQKCLDHELADALDYYKAIVLNLARLAAAHKTGLLSPQVDELFPFDLDSSCREDALPWKEGQLRQEIANYRDFAARCPQLVPENIATPGFIDQMEDDAIRILRNEVQIKRYLNSAADMIALSHYNANIDNAWFWRDAEGVMQCGLFDWQRARQMNVAFALWGSLCSADLEILDKHLDELLVLFKDELHDRGGPSIDLGELKLSLHLYATIIGLSGLLGTPLLVLKELPEAVNASGPHDPMFRGNEAARSFLHVFTVLLHLWQTRDFGSSMDQVLSRTPPPCSVSPL